MVNDVVLDLFPLLHQLTGMELKMSGNGSSIDCDSIHVEGPGEISATLVMLSEQLN